MGIFAPIVARSGSGKSSSGRNLNPNTTYWANCDTKPLPIPKALEKYNVERGNYLESSDPNDVTEFLKKANKNKDVKEVLIDTMSHIMTDFVMSKTFRKTNGFDKWSNLSGGMYDLIDIINKKMRPDIIVYCMFHPEESTNDEGFRVRRIAVQGKALEKIAIESFASVVLFSTVEKLPNQPAKYLFQTQTDGVSTAKTPMGMFEEETIENDLVLVSQKIREYYGL